jgi:hypothetical protein
MTMHAGQGFSTAGAAQSPHNIDLASATTPPLAEPNRIGWPFAELQACCATNPKQQF